MWLFQWLQLLLLQQLRLQRLSQLEGIIPALETSHAIAHLETLCPQLEGSPRIVLNCSGRGDKDVQTVAAYLEQHPSS